MSMATSRPRNSLVGLALILMVGTLMPPAVSAIGGRSTPRIDQISARDLAPRIQPQLLTISGQGFAPGLSLLVTAPEGWSMEYKDDAITALQESSFRVSASLASAGRYSFVVTNRDGGMSDVYLLLVTGERRPLPPVIERVLPDDIFRRDDPQELVVLGRRFGSGCRAVLMDPLGVEVPDLAVLDVTPASLRLRAVLESAGPYDLVVISPSGVASNVATIVVK